MNLLIRRATAADAATLMELAQRLGTFALPRWRSATDVIEADGRDMVRAVMEPRPGHDVFIAELSGEPAGCLYVLAATDFFGTRHAHVSVIATSAAAEGSGVGRALIDRAEAWAREKNLPLLTLNVFAGNARARRFYEQAGFEVEMLKYAKELT